MMHIAQAHICSCVMQVYSLLSSGVRNVHDKTVCLQNLTFTPVYGMAQWTSVLEFVTSHVSME